MCIVKKRSEKNGDSSNETKTIAKKGPLCVLKKSRMIVTHPKPVEV